MIGIGSFGEVVKAHQKNSGTVVAIKLLKDIFASPYKIRQVLGEIQVLRRLSKMQENMPGKHAYTTKILDIIIYPKSEKTPILEDSLGDFYEEQESDFQEDGIQFDHIFIVMDCMESDLRKIMDIVPKKLASFQVDQMVKIFYNLLQAINFLHTAGIMHRDIKPANILINQDCSVKLCDFGLSRPVPRKAQMYR